MQHKIILETEDNELVLNTFIFVCSYSNGMCDCACESIQLGTHR